MAWRRTWYRIKEPVTGFAGAGFGLTTSELAAEFTARTTGQMGYMKAGVKTVVKLILGAVFFGLGLRAPGAWSLFGKVAGFSSWGSTVLDWIFAAYPGGIPGLAERMAVSVRTWAMGAEKVAAEITALEEAAAVGKYTTSQGASTQKVASTPTIGKYR